MSAKRKALIKAAKHADWMQVVLNQGPPCFHLEDDKFCLRAQRWAGHGKADSDIHAFVSLADLLAQLPPPGPETETP